MDGEADRHQLRNDFRLPRNSHGFLQEVKASKGQSGQAGKGAYRPTAA
jgi:hypothetical protein